jgi:hypothetical protein
MSAHCAVAPGQEGRARTGVYRRRRPERTVVYRLVQEYLETWLVHKREADPDGDPVAAYVERDFRKFMDCGILARGFARARCEACGHDYLIAYSCKGRGVCGSCTTRRMAEAAAHLVDHVVPAVPIRQWVFSLPKRLRYFLLRDPMLLNSVLRLALREVERALRSHSAGASARGRTGGVVFIHRFGAMLNVHLHLHCCVIDGLIESEGEGIGFRPAVVDTETIAQVQRAVRARVLRLFARRGVLSEEAAEQMGHWRHGGGFGVHAGVRIEAQDKEGRERLFRYCARPLYAGERLEWDAQHEQVSYRLSKPGPRGETVLRLSPSEFFDRIAALIPPPRRHRHRYFGVLAPNAPLRAAVTARAGLPIGGEPAQEAQQQHDVAAVNEKGSGTAHYLWAMLLARIYEVLPLHCPHCGSEMRIISLVSEPEPIKRVLEHIGEASTPPPISRARAPPIAEADLDQSIPDVWLPEHAAEFEVDQTVSW